MDRIWLRDRLVAAPLVTDLVPAARIFAAGSLDENVPERPFIIVKEGTNLRGPFPGVASKQPSIWAHDDPGSYLLVDEILAAIRTTLEGPMEGFGVECRWLSDSMELADEGYKTITRNSNYSLHGRSGSS